MTLKKLIFCLSTSLLIYLGAAASARADAVIITSGSLSVSGLASPSDSPHGFSFTGAGFQGGGGGEPWFSIPTNGCGAHAFCYPGGLVDASGRATFGIHGSCSYTFEGTSSPFGSCRQSHFDFSADAVRLPLTFSDSNAFTVTTNFTMTGTFIISDFATNQTFVTLPVSGQGTAVLTLRHYPAGAGTIMVDSIRFTFAPTATPEPATLLLLGTGLAGTAWGARRRRKSRHDN